MKATQDLNQYGLDSLELKALSVPSSLRFLLGIEYDVVLCVNVVGTRRPFRLHFPVFAVTFRKLLTLCATRFGLDCDHSESESVLSGTAVMPLLRYADYLPGALHMKEILECLQVVAATKAKKWQSPIASSPSSSPNTGSAVSEDSPTTNSHSGNSYANEFEASFIDYSEFASESSLDDVHGLGFYLTLDYGLSLATHSHLVGIRFHKDWDAKEALREFQEFSGWSEFDLRFLDEQNRQEGGVIVMPSSQDACDLLEKYEDEDSDDDGDLLPFILRPVSPLVSVPSLEDSALRKLRDQHWATVEKHWAHLPRTLNTVVVYNLYDDATLPEILAFFEPLPIVASEFVEDDAPSHRRRAFLTFANLEATRKALDVDGKNTRGCTLRVQVSPPYISLSRRGHEVKPEHVAPAQPTAGSLPKMATNNGNGEGRVATAASLRSCPATRAAADNPAHAKSSGAGAHGGAAERPAEASKAQPHTRVVSAPSAPVTAAAAAHATVPSSATHSAPVSTVATVTPSQNSSSSAFSAAATRRVNTSAAIASAIAARAHTATAATTATEAPKSAAAEAASTSLTSAPAVLPWVSPTTTLKEPVTNLSAGSAPLSHAASHMNASAKEFVPHFQLNATSPEYHPSPAPTVDVLYGFNGLPASVSDVAAIAATELLSSSLPPPPPPPPPPPAYGNAMSSAADYRPTPRSTQLLHPVAALNLPAYALPPPYLPGAEGMDENLPPPPY